MKSDPDPQPTDGQRWHPAWWAARSVCWILMTVFCRVRVVGLRAGGGVPEGPLLLAGNHISHFDPPVVGVCAGRKVDFMAMRELFTHPVAAWILGRVCDAFPVSRGGNDPGAVRTAVRRLRRGRIVFVFPEGGIRSGSASVLGGAPMPGGAASLAQMAGVPILPVILLGTDRLYRWQNLWRRPHLLVAFGDSLHLDPALEGAAARSDLNRRLHQAWLDLHAQLKAHPDYHPVLEPRTARERWSETP